MILILEANNIQTYINPKGKGEKRMSNYCCVTRSIYFRVKNDDEFIDFARHVYGVSYSVDVNTYEKNGKTYFSFGCHSEILGYFNTFPFEAKPEEWESAHDKFIDGLQKHVADDDAIIITEVGYEKLRSVCGHIRVITKDDCQYKNTDDVALEMARSMLNNSCFETRFDY